MKTKSIFSVLALAVVFFLLSCGGGSTTSTETSEEETTETQQMETRQAPETATEEMASNSDIPYFELGKKIYDEKCVTCHMKDGKGVEKAFPPLANSDYLLADKKRAVEQVLNGSNEEMVVNGVTYNAPMPPQVDTKKEAVAVINYVLNSWGNDGGIVTLEEVEDIDIIRE